jgi:protein arginine kinase
LVHLPGLLEASQLPAIIDDLLRQGLVATSFPGLNERVNGGLLRLRTTAALGRSEKEIGRDFVSALAQLVKAEIDQRNSWLQHNRLALADRVHRALGMLREARLLSQDEALVHLSHLRLGRHSGLLADELPEGIDPLLYRVLPGHLASWAELNHEDGHPDALRARYIRRFFA